MVDYKKFIGFKVRVIIFLALLAFMLSEIVIKLYSFDFVSVRQINMSGMFLSFVGAFIITLNLIIPKGEAIRLGVSRWGGETEEENLGLPRVRALQRQAKSALWALSSIATGFLLQLLAELLKL